jgi:uncharacterized protein YqeY
MSGAGQGGGVDRASPGLRDRLRRALAEAMRRRDRVAIVALRSALAAIDNAEAADAATAPRPAAGRHFAGTVAGLGAGEGDRRRLTETGVQAVVRAEVADRMAAADRYQRSGHPDRADRLRAEATVLSGHLRHEG